MRTLSQDQRQRDLGHQQHESLKQQSEIDRLLQELQELEAQAKADLQKALDRFEKLQAYKSAMNGING
jgi:flagellar motility protein MotE (MotC chaperone)